MFYRKCNCFNNRQFCCTNMTGYDENDLENKYNNINNQNLEIDDCKCGFEEQDNGLPENPMLAQSYVPIQKMDKVFKPEIGLRKGTIFPELVSPYFPNQSLEEIEYIKATNKGKEGCNG